MSYPEPTGSPFLLDPPCRWCGRVMYRHPIILWALQCLTCDRPRSARR